LKGSNIPGDCEGYKPMSHYDQIRSMSVEELAEAFSGGLCPSFIGGQNECIIETATCKECWLGWLRSEAEEDE
jgi:hypothetical protein